MNDTLTAIADSLRATLEAKNAAREQALAQSRELIRHCSECIRAVHRHDWANAQAKLAQVDATAHAMRATVAPHADLVASGYVQDALKEQVEAHLTLAMIRDTPLPTPQALGVDVVPYLNGMAEAASELRRFILDLMRRQEAHSQEAERLLDWMDIVYDHLITFDFPDALTGGLRRQTDVLRGVLERTRGDLTMSLRQQLLQDALRRAEATRLPTSED